MPERKLIFIANKSESPLESCDIVAKIKRFGPLYFNLQSLNTGCFIYWMPQKGPVELKKKRKNIHQYEQLLVGTKPTSKIEKTQAVP